MQNNLKRSNSINDDISNRKISLFDDSSEKNNKYTGLSYNQYTSIFNEYILILLILLILMNFKILEINY